MRVRQWALAAVVTASVAGLMPAAAIGPVARVRLVSAAVDGEPGDRHSGVGIVDPYRDSDRSASRNGRYVVFDSHAENLAPASSPCPGDWCTDVFLKDTWNGRVEQISVGMGGAAPDLASKDPSITPDGRYVVFVSNATNLVPGGGTGIWERVFRHDRQSGVTELVSIDLPADAAATWPSISDDGRFVSYHAAAAQWNPAGDLVHLRDMSSTTTTLVSHTPTGLLPNGGSTQPVISGNGRYVAYQSTATDLITPADPNDPGHVYRWDRLTDTTLLASYYTSLIGQVNGNGLSDQPSISQDGSVVAFVSESTNLGTPNVHLRQRQVFVQDLTAQWTFPISLNDAGAEADSLNSDPSISADGRYVAFTSGAENLVPGDTNEDDDVFVRDRQQGTTARVSVRATGAQSEPGATTPPAITTASSKSPAITADGSQVVFTSYSENLVLDGNHRHDVFIGPASGVQPPFAPLSITGLRCSPSTGLVECVVTYTGGVTPVRITWTANNTTVSGWNQTTMTLQCPSRPIFRVPVDVTVVDDLHRTAQRTVRAC